MATCNEKLRLVPFLRKSCDSHLYGLAYLDPEKTLLQIPWPVVPKQSSGVPPGFEIFHDWALKSMSMQSRNRELEHCEPPTQKKHRFRNALSKAPGIKYRADIKINEARVYQFVDDQHWGSTSSPISESPTEFNPTLLTGYPNGSYSIPAPNYPIVPYNEEMPFVDGSPTETMIPTPSDNQDTCAAFENDAAKYIDPIVPEPHQGQVIGAGFCGNVTDAPSCSQQEADEMQAWSLTDLLQLAPEDSTALEVKVCFRQEDASRCYVTGNGGCRLYFGQNVQTLSQMLEQNHLDHIMKMFRFEKDHYYGPENWEQIQLPQPNDYMRSQTQKHKTEAILNNMERGLLLYIDRSSCNSMQISVPDVYAMRLCQTRIFPCQENTSQQCGMNQAPETLERMKWTKVFDGKKFVEQFSRIDQLPSAEYPSPSFSLSLGQRPSNEKPSLLFVCITVTVQQAQQLIQNRLDCDRVCISYNNSSDVEASHLANRLNETLKLQQQCEKVF